MFTNMTITQEGDCGKRMLAMMIKEETDNYENRQTDYDGLW
jgi:hypothetical protein